MRPPKVSVVIPAYNQARFIAQAIQSVCDQTFSDWQLIIVDDGSTDATADVVKQFGDSRIEYIYQANKGLPGARNTGINNASGTYIAFLDADDIYHADKLRIQVAHLEQDPNIGLSYCARIHIDQQGTPFWIYPATKQATLQDLVVGFPFTINDILVRRALVEEIDGFDESFKLHGEDRDFYLRLALAGCQFVGVNRALAYRRFHANRIFKRIPERIKVMLQALDTAFADPGCPQSVVALRNTAHGKIYLYWAYQEFVQQETARAQQHLHEAMQLVPAYFEHGASKFLRFLIWTSMSSNEDHESALRNVFEQLPSELDGLKTKCTWAVAQSHLLKGTREVMWGRLDQGRYYFARALQDHVEVDRAWVNICADQIAAHEVEFGLESTDKILKNLAVFLASLGSSSKLRQLQGNHAINRAFKLDQAGAYAAARAHACEAILYMPRLLINRGVLSVLIRSILAPGIRRLGWA